MCSTAFDKGEARLALSSDMRARASRYYHVFCVPGGFHARDSIEGILEAPPAVQEEIRVLRVAEAEMDDGEVTLPVARIPRTVADAGGESPNWWTTMSWEHAKQIRSGTLIDVPRVVKAAFADLKLDLIAESRRVCRQPPAKRDRLDEAELHRLLGPELHPEPG